MNPTGPFRIGFLLFPRLTQLDLTGPYEVLARMPGAEVSLIAKTLDPVVSERGLAILPTTTFAACPPLELVCVPGGPGSNAAMTDTETLAFLRRAAESARYVTSVCTGSLVLAAAGLLRGRRAACHWMSRDLLRRLNVEPAAERVVSDGKFISGGGVTAGIDFALAVIAEIRGREVAEAIQLMIEYDPHPPFSTGTPERAPPALVAQVRERAAGFMQEREDAVGRAAAALGIR